MSLVHLEEVHTGYSTSKINTNFQKLQQVLNYNREKRDITTDNEFQKKFKAGDEGNEMRTDIVMGAFKVINPVGIVTLRDIYEIIGYPGGTCTTVADIMLIVDNTGSQKQDEYYTLTLPAISNMIDSLITLGRDMTLGSVVIKEVSYLLTSLSDNLATTQAAINGLPAPTGWTSLASAINLAKIQLDTNGREDVPGFIVIITDGVPNYANYLIALTEAEAAATAAKDAGYLIVVFGVVGQDLSDQEGGGGG